MTAISEQTHSGSNLFVYNYDLYAPDLQDGVLLAFLAAEFRCRVPVTDGWMDLSVERITAVSRRHCNYGSFSFTDYLKNSFPSR